MSGEAWLRSPEQVQAWWHEFAARRQAQLGFRFPNRRDADRFRTSRKKLVAYMNHSRWVADCPMTNCNGGIAVWIENPQACCLDCGTIFSEVRWPSETDMARAMIEALNVPFDEERNYDPRTEKAEDAVARMRAVTA